jgi:hypothetical protein
MSFPVNRSQGKTPLGWDIECYLCATEGPSHEDGPLIGHISIKEDKIPLDANNTTKVTYYALDSELGCVAHLNCLKRWFNIKPTCPRCHFSLFGKCSSLEEQVDTDLAKQDPEDNGLIFQTLDRKKVHIDFPNIPAAEQEQGEYEEYVEEQSVKGYRLFRKWIVYNPCPVRLIDTLISLGVLLVMMGPFSYGLTIFLTLAAPQTVILSCGLLYFIGCLGLIYWFLIFLRDNVQSVRVFRESRSFQFVTMGSQLGRLSF